MGLFANLIGGNVQDSSMIGSIQMFTGTSAPSGYLVCDGTAVSRTEYSSLFDVIGTVYGIGNGSTTFNLPNFKGKVPVGHDTAQTEFNTVGKTGGAKTHSLSVNEMPSHNHSVNNSEIDSTDAGTRFQNTSSTSGSISMTTNNTGGGQAHNNLQPYITINYIIKC